MIARTPTVNGLEAARARCAAYCLIAHGFRYPDDAWLSSLVDRARWDGWPERFAQLHADVYSELSSLRAVVWDLAPPTASTLLQVQFAGLFGHAVRGACPPYELEFGKSEVIQRASELADICGFYAAFGMELTGGISERADHVSVEAEFLAALCGKEACGIEGEHSELIEAACGAQRQFLNSHLGQWLPAFAQRVTDSEPCDFYTRLSGFATAFVRYECERAGVPLGSPYLDLRPSDPAQEASQSCGLPGERCVPGVPQLTQLSVHAEHSTR
ncbi:MAG: molecular chaperone [Phycisphaerae bacterium]